MRRVGLYLRVFTRRTSASVDCLRGACFISPSPQPVSAGEVRFQIGICAFSAASPAGVMR
jgi:hypothetical protein